ncbi:carbohydrate kinase family protein [Algicella marina]|uniref:Carbohydrate kinase n=1 Tax=Algicella marina TaxID=2683284 RepID=A0A6P1SWN5_9RHOB|nr:carbohydrate kinase [Algicella marina]QHQ35084.1 carbohydrate kinase [Algicella marina]
MIVFGGENLIDFIQEEGAEGYPLYRAIPGGSPYNTAKATVRQEVPVGYMTPFSSDSLGVLLVRELEAEGVKLLGATSEKPTSLAVVSLNNGHATYQFYRENTAERDITQAALQATLPKGTEVFHVGSLALTNGADAEAWTAFFEEVARAGTFTSLDPNVRAAFINDRDAYLARLERLYSSASLIKLSDEDLGWIAPGEDMEAATRAIFARSSAALVVLTKGAEGAYGVTKDETFDIAPVAVPDLKDTVGAGDTFMGTLLAQSSRAGLTAPGALAAAPAGEIRRILETAARAAAINCARSGCNPPRLDELDG